MNKFKDKYNIKAMSLSDTLFEELKTIPIAEVCDKLNIELHGNCPSGHNSESQNCFHVNEHGNYFKCFNCKSYGDVVDLVQLHSNCDIVDACKFLTEQFRPDLTDKINNTSPEEAKKIKEYKEKETLVLKALDYAMSYYEKKLQETPEALKYITDRTVTEDFIKNNKYVRFGYAPVNQTDLKRSMIEKFGKEITFLTGIFREKDSYSSMSIYIKELQEAIPGNVYSYQVKEQTKYLIIRRISNNLPGEKGDNRFRKLFKPEDPILKNEIFGIDSLEIKNPAFKNSILISEGLFDAILAIQNNIPTISPITTQFSQWQIDDMVKAAKRFDTVYIVPDPDKPGETGATKTAKELFLNGKTVKVVSLPRIEGVKKYDLADYFKEHSAEDFFTLCKAGTSLIDFLIGTIPADLRKTELYKTLKDKELIELIDSLDVFSKEEYIEKISKKFKTKELKKLFSGKQVKTAKETEPLHPNEKKQAKKKNQTDQANEIIEKIKDTLKTRWDGKSLYILNSNKKWMDIDAGGEQELLKQIYHATGIIPSPDTQKIIITILKFLQDNNKEGSPPRRSTFKEDAILYNTGKHFVSISKDEIQKKEHDCIFLENELQIEHPDFVLNSEESLEDLISELIPVKTQEDKLLLSVYLASLFVPEISKPALNLEGDQGSGKTSIARTIKRIYDPSKIEMVDYGKIQDLCLTFAYNDFLILNNLSKIKSNTSDVLCNIIDGKCISERQLFTNNKLFISEIKGTFAITAIETGKKNSDLLDRMIKITLERISSEKRLPEKKLERLFNKKLPSILSAIFHLLQEALKHIQHIEDTEIPEFRLADWYLWSLSIATAMGKADEFKRIIKLQKEIMLNDEISNNDVVETIFKYLEDRLQHVNSLSMTSTEWIDVINEYAKRELIKGRIGGIFKRVKVTFDSLGYVFTEKKEGRNKRLWEVAKKTKNCVSEKNVTESHSLNGGDRGDTEDIFYVSSEKTVNKQLVKCGDTETQNSNYLEFLENNISIDIGDTTDCKNEKEKDIKVIKNCVSMSPDTIKPYTEQETEETQNGDIKNSLCLYVSGYVSEKISCKNCNYFVEGSSPAAMGTCKLTKNTFYSGELHTCSNYAEPELEESPF